MLNDEEIYQRARKIVGSQMQVITYNEFLPILLVADALAPYAGYNDAVDVGISNEFSTAAYRFGHSMISPSILRVNQPGNRLVTTSLKDAYFNPRLVLMGGGISSILNGLTVREAQAIDTHMVDGLRNFLFGEPGQGGLDLAALNIQRGRDHGLADYNKVRKALKLKPVTSFAAITSDVEMQAKLAQAYDSVNDMDLWVAGLAEDAMPGALVGGTFYAILVDQFTRLRDGDIFWYQNDPYFTSNPALLAEIENTRLANIIRRNTGLDSSMIQDNVFLVNA